MRHPLMKKFALALALIALTALCIATIKPAEAQVPGSWTIMPSLPEYANDYSHAAAAVDGKIYVIGGEYNIQYDPTTNAYQNRTPWLNSSLSFSVVVYQEEIYVLGGYLRSPTQAYDPVNDTWRIVDKDGVYRIGASASIVDDKIYIIGGAWVPNIRYAPEVVDWNTVYDITNDSWITMAPMPTALMGYASAVVNGKIYIFGGVEPHDYSPDVIYDLVQIYDPKTNEWSQGTPMPTAVCWTSACATSGTKAPKRIYVIGGEVESNNILESTVINQTQIYDPETDSWSYGASMPTARSFASLTNIDDTIYAIGGKNENGYSLANEKYVPIGYNETPSPTPSTSPNASPTPLPSPSIPEFPPWAILPLISASTVLLAVAVRKTIRGEVKDK